MLFELKTLKIGETAQKASKSGIKSLLQLCDYNYTEKQLLALHEFKSNAIRILKEELSNHSLSFKEYKHGVGIK